MLCQVILCDVKTVWNEGKKKEKLWSGAKELTVKPVNTQWGKTFMTAHLILSALACLYPNIFPLFPHSQWQESSG